MEQNWIESLKTLTEMSVLVRALGLTPQKEAEFWKQLLTYLKSETEPVEEEDMTEVAKIIASAVFSSDNEIALDNLRARSLKLCAKHPLYS